MTQSAILKQTIFTIKITDLKNLMPRQSLFLPMLNKNKEELTSSSLTEVLSILLLEDKLTMQEQLQLETKLIKLRMLPKQENASYIISMKQLILKLYWEPLFMGKLMLKEETLLELSILELISSMQLQEEFQVLIFGKMVLRKLKHMPTQTSLITLLLPKKKRCKLKTKQTGLFCNVILFVNISKVRKKQNLSMDSTFIKEVLFQVIPSEL